MRKLWVNVDDYLVQVVEAEHFFHADDMQFYVSKSTVNGFGILINEMVLFGVARVGKGNFFRLNPQLAESMETVSSLLRTINSLVADLRRN